MASNIDVIFTKNGIIQLTDSFNGLVGSSGTVVNTKTVSGQIDAYTRCSVVQDAIDIKASYHSSLKIAAIDKQGKWINGDYASKGQQAVIDQDMKNIEWFNEQEGFMRFNHRLKTHLLIFGRAYVHKEKKLGLDEYNYYIIPNNIIQEVYVARPSVTSYFLPEVDYYQVCVGSEMFKLSTDEVFVFTDRLAGFNRIGTHSRLYGLEEAISTLLSTDEMLTQLLADGGARGIITQGASNIDMISAGYLDEEKADIQRSLKDYGLLKDKYKYIVTKGQAGYVPLTSRIVDMQIPEIALMKKIQIYRAMGIPTAFGVNESRFKVLPEARKEMFTSSVIPEGQDLFEAQLRMKGIENPSFCKYVADYTHFDFFQESLKESGVAFQQASNALVPLVNAGIITMEQAHAYLNPYLL